MDKIEQQAMKVVDLLLRWDDAANNPDSDLSELDGMLVDALDAAKDIRAEQRKQEAAR